MSLSPRLPVSWFIGIALVSLFLLVPLGSARALTVSPVRLELSGDPGSQISSSFKVTNDEAETKSLYTTFENFEALGESGTPNFKPDTEGLASWLRAPDQVELAPGETKTVDFSIEIPASAEPGGYFAAIFLGSTPPASNSNEVAIGSRIGSLVLFRVNGDIEEGGTLLEFSTIDKKKIYTSLPVNFFYRFNNTGADRVFPKGSLTIKNTLGMKTAIIDANPTQGNILPRSIRRFELWWKKDSTDGLPATPPAHVSFFETVGYQWKNFAFGTYRANLAITYGSNQEVVNSSYRLFIFPWQLLIVEVLSLVIIFFLVRFLLQRYNSWIIKKAKGGRRS